jgi:hypothetical protein
MAQKPKAFDYTFQLQSDTLIKVNKLSDDGEALQNYTVKGNLRGACFCDCPASWSQKRHGKPDKHVGWVHRYMRIMDAWGSKLPEGAYVYYKSGEDKFYVNNALAMSQDEQVPET